MNKILTHKDAILLAQKIRTDGKKIVLAGGCFDILHKGHLTYLENAKREGNILIIALECDENVRRLKGLARPVHDQFKRANALAGLDFVDYIFILPPLESDLEYAQVTRSLTPNIIAVTQGDPKQNQKEIQARSINGIVKIVTERLTEFSTTKLLLEK